MQGQSCVLIYKAFESQNILSTTTKGTYFYHSFTHEETEAQRTKVKMTSWLKKLTPRVLVYYERNFADLSFQRSWQTSHNHIIKIPREQMMQIGTMEDSEGTDPLGEVCQSSGCETREHTTC